MDIKFGMLLAVAFSTSTSCSDTCVPDLVVCECDPPAQISSRTSVEAGAWHVKVWKEVARRSRSAYCRTLDSGAVMRGRWRGGSHLPVLKHGPRSLAHVRVSVSQMH